MDNNNQSPQKTPKRVVSSGPPPVEKNNVPHNDISEDSAADMPTTVIPTAKKSFTQNQPPRRVPPQNNSSPTRQIPVQKPHTASEANASRRPTGSVARNPANKIPKNPVSPRDAYDLGQDFRSIDYTYGDRTPLQNTTHEVSSRSKKGKSVRRRSSSGRPPRVRRVTTGSAYEMYPDTSDYEKNGHTMLSSVMKAVIYIVFILVSAGFLSYYSIMIGNDIFAFVKSSEEITVTIPEYATIDDIAKVLSKNNVIEYPSMFKLYSKLRKKDKVEFVAGDYIVSPSSNYDSLIKQFRNITAVTRDEIRITFKEGSTIDEMIDIFIENGIGTREKFIDVIQNGEFNYWFIDELMANGYSEKRRYRLEGYLFPDTYNFYTDSDEKTAIAKMLDNFDKQFDERYKESCEAIGRTVDQVVNIASLIQAEAKYVQEYTTISSVFHNRLNNTSYETQGYLQSDAALQYIFTDHKAIVTQEDTKIDNPYNTYANKGLPPGPVCNPSLNAISAALYPEETNYYYFVSCKSGYSLWATTYEEHKVNIKEAKSGN